MNETRRCLDCRKKFVMRRHDEELCPKCSGEESRAHRPNIDPTKGRTGDYYNFRHNGEGYPVFKR